MSKASAYAAIKSNFNNAVPAISPEIISDEEISDTADANDAHRAIMRLKKLRETKEIQYKQVIDRANADKRETLDVIDAAIHKLDRRLKTFAKPRLDGRHLDLPAGRIQFTTSASVHISDDVEDLDSKVEQLAGSHPKLVRKKYQLDKNAIKEAAKEGDLPDWLEVVELDSVTYSEDTKSTPIEEPSREKGSIADDLAKAPIFEDDSIPEAKKVEEKPEVKDPPKGVDTTKGPRIFEVPSDEHFADETKLANKAETFVAFDVAKLLEGQTRVTLEHVSTLPIDKIKGGMVAMMGKMGMGRPETRRWVAYHIGMTAEAVDPSKLDDKTWRRLLALAVHAHTVMEKHKAEG